MSDLSAALRAVQDVAVDCGAPTEVLQSAADLLEQVAGLLRPWTIDARRPLEGETSGRAGVRTFAPLIVVDQMSDSAVSARVTFTRFYLGAPGAVHGGAIAVVFDQLLGGLLNPPSGALRATAAYLKMNLRKFTPIGEELAVDVSIDGRDGRKLFVSGRLRNADNLFVDCEGLFVAPRSS